MCPPKKLKFKPSHSLTNHPRMRIFSPCDQTVADIMLDTDTEPCAQGTLNGQGGLYIFHNIIQAVTFAIYRGQTFEVAPHATLKQLLDILFAHDDYTFKYDPYYNTFFDAPHPLGMTLHSIYMQTGIFHFNISYPVAI